MLLSLVPGWGHVYWGREALGIGIFSAAALVGFGFLNTWLVYQGSGKTTMVWVFGVVFCLVMAANWIDIFCVPIRPVLVRTIAGASCVFSAVPPHIYRATST